MARLFLKLKNNMGVRTKNYKPHQIKQPSLRRLLLIKGAQAASPASKKHLEKS